MPDTALASKPGTKSPMTGRSGSAGEGIAVLTASARSLPARSGSIDADSGSNISSDCPSIVPLSATGPPPV